MNDVIFTVLRIVFVGFFLFVLFMSIKDGLNKK